MLTPKSCDLFNIPFFQFAQLKKYQPESIPQIKADYKENWQIWQQGLVRTRCKPRASGDDPTFEGVTRVVGR